MPILMLQCALLCLLLLWPGFSWSAEPHFPALTGRVVDQANIIDAKTRRDLEKRLAAYEQATTNQVVVVTLKSLEDRPIEDYGYQLGRYWGIGQKEKNNGVLLIVAPQERQTRIEVGYGLEGDLTDAASKMIIEHVMLPYFRKDEYSQGIAEGVSAILSVLKGEIASEDLERAHEEGLNPWMALFLLILLFIVLRSLRHGDIVPVMVLDSLLDPRTYTPSRHHRGGFGGGGGFSSGGGFRGGGGSFGGGGASGRW